MPTIEELQEVLAQSRRVDLAAVVLPRDERATREVAALEQLTAVQYWVRLVRAVEAERSATRAPSSAAAWERIAEHLASVGIERALEMALRPDVTSWVWSARSGSGGDSGHPGDRVPGLQLLGHLAGDLGATEPGGQVPTAPVLPSGGGSGAASHRETGTYLDWPHRRRVLVNELETAGRTARPVERAEEVAAILVLRPCDVLARSILPDQEGAEETAGAEGEAWRAALHEALVTTRTRWPAGVEAVTGAVRVVGRLHGDAGLRPLNYSMHAARGLVMLSSRPAYMTAQSLVHEAAHNRVSNLVDCFDVFTNPTATAWSPFVALDRPLGHVLHGLVSFINDVHAAQVWEDVVTGEDVGRLQRYVSLHTERLATAMAGLREVAQPTEPGRRLLQGVEDALEFVLNAGGRAA